MNRRLQIVKGVTLAELLVAGGAVVLLFSLSVPVLSTSAGRDAQATCLANLRQIAAVSMAYATDDPREQLVPLAMVDVRAEGGTGIDPRYFAGACLPAAFGGRTPVTDLVGNPNPHVMRSVEDGGNGYWTARRRPLTIYGALAAGPSSIGTNVFHCPADTGYPTPPEEYPSEIYPMPPESYNVPLFDVLGNSYRESYRGFYVGSLEQGRFNTTPLGHTASSIASPLAQTVLYCEPLFYMGTLFDPSANVNVIGWHGGVRSDNVAYCDGSARFTEVGQIHEFSDAELDAMGVSHDLYAGYFLRRGPTWQLDCYPTPGAEIRTWTFDGQLYGANLVHKNWRGWPFDNYQTNQPPD